MPSKDPLLSPSLTPSSLSWDWLEEGGIRHRAERRKRVVCGQRLSGGSGRCGLRVVPGDHHCSAYRSVLGARGDNVVNEGVPFDVQHVALMTAHLGVVWLDSACLQGRDDALVW